MKLRARHRGIDDLHDEFFERIKGRSLSKVAHHNDETTHLHYHELTFSKPGEPDAMLPVVPVTALVRPQFSLSRERVMQLQQLLVEKSSALLGVLDSFELAQLHYCIGSVWAVAWLPLQDGAKLQPEPKHEAERYPGMLGPEDMDPARGSQSEGAALSGRAQRAVPPEASPEGRNTPSEVIARVACSQPPELTGTEPTLPVLHPLHSIDCEIDNRTEFAIKASATFFGKLPLSGARYELERCVFTIDEVMPQPGAIWPE